MTVEFDVQLQPKDLFRFNMYQSYTGSQGIISLLITILAVVMSVVAFQGGNLSYGVMYLVFGLIFLFYIPGALWSRAKLTLKSNEVLAGKLHYTVSEENITVTLGEDSGVLEWNQIYKMIATKHNVLIYSGRKNAYVVPKSQLADQYARLAEIANKKLEKHRVNMK